METIDNIVLNRQTRGLAISFAREARALARDHGKDYRSAHQVAALHCASWPEARETRARRAVMAAPQRIGQFDALPDGPDIVARGLAVKNPDSLIVGVPECYDFTLPILKCAGDDALSLYGPDRFKKSEFLLVVQRTDVEPGEAHRESFSGWHNHMTDPGAERDLIYSFCTVLPTQFRFGKDIIEPPQNALTRFGAEFPHRSQTNESDETLRRVWGAVIVTSGRRTYTRNDNTPFNVAIDEGRTREFRKAARAYFNAPTVNFIPHESPQPLAGVA